MIEKLYTLDEVADMCRVNKHTVYKWVRCKSLKALKMGRHWRVKESDLQSYIDGLKAEREEKKA
jgi:excisionase family DNA binding protein